jgi:hypothetical protein
MLKLVQGKMWETDFLGHVHFDLEQTVRPSRCMILCSEMVCGMNTITLLHSKWRWRLAAPRSRKR